MVNEQVVTNAQRRQAATEDFKRAEAAVNAVFDRHDELLEALRAVAGVAGGADPVRAALDVVDGVARVEAALAALQRAAMDATGWRTRGEVAGYVDSKPAVLFGRGARAASQPTGDGDVDEAAGGGGDDGAGFVQLAVGDSST